MKILKTSLFLLTLCIFTGSVLAQDPQLGKASIKEVIAAMTLEEKASLVVGTRGFGQTGPMIGQTQALVPGAAGTTLAIPRLGITPMVLADGPAGLRISPTRENDQNTYYCTAFPVATLLASTWNTDLVAEVGKAMGNEVLEYGADVLLAPGMNIHRNPLCGRNFEYYSEDPYVSGKMAAAMVKGVQSQGVGTSIKHFVANNSETNRNTVNTIVGERALREIYLESFRIAVEESQPWTVMSSYNLVNGTYTAERYDLITDVLRKDWGFKGHVMTDWGGGTDHVAEVRAGNDLIMPGSPDQIQEIIKGVKDGKLDEKDLDRNIEKMLTIMLETPRFKGYKYSNKPDLKAHAQVTRQTASEGMVLLKNSNGTLPLADTTLEVAAFGKTSYALISGGTGSGDVNEAYTVSLVEGLENVNLKINQNLKTMYESFLGAVKDGRPQLNNWFRGQAPIEELGISKSLAESMANYADVALITIGRNSGEGSDRSPNEGDFKLSDAEVSMIKTVTEAFHAKGKKSVVVLNVGGVIETASWKAIPDAILLAWQAGQEAGNTIADILTGKVNPSGKLTMTFPMNYQDNPSSGTFPGKELPTTEPQDPNSMWRRVPAEITYEDGIYVGYRYYETFNIEPSYEFGFGLSYSDFEFSNLKLSSTKFKNSITVTVDVKNTGKVAGKEVAQLYLSAPKGKLDKPVMELKSFGKTKLLNPGESQTLTFVIDNRSLASFDPDSDSWIADAGTYKVQVGSSIKDIKGTANFSLAANMVVKKVTNSVLPQVAINELKPE